MQARVWIITGNHEAGKTSFCRRVLFEAQTRGFKTGGVLSPAVFENGIKTGIEVQDVASGKKRLLATLREEVLNAVTKRWKFDEAALNWGSTLLYQSVPCDVLIVDELGPLELEHGQGWVEGMRAINSGNYQAALVVIRPELMPTALQRWPKAEVMTFSRSDPPDVLNRMIELILRDLAT